MTVNLSNRTVAGRTAFKIEDTKDSNGLFVHWENRFHRYDLCPSGKKTATDLLNGKATDDDWILLIDGMFTESVGSSKFIKNFLEKHTPNFCTKIRNLERKGGACVVAILNWNGYNMSSDSFIGTYYKN